MGTSRQRRIPARPNTDRPLLHGRGAALAAWPRRAYQAPTRSEAQIASSGDRVNNAPLMQFTHCNSALSRLHASSWRRRVSFLGTKNDGPSGKLPVKVARNRSEERRVGKE